MRTTECYPCSTYEASGQPRPLFKNLQWRLQTRLWPTKKLHLCPLRQVGHIYQVASGAEKERLQCVQEEHHKDAHLGYDCKTDDKKAAVHSWRGKKWVLGRVLPRSKDAVVFVITYYFQQNLETSTLRHNMFYTRQLWTYNFGVHDCVVNQGIMHLWPETVVGIMNKSELPGKQRVNGGMFFFWTGQLNLHFSKSSWSYQKSVKVIECTKQLLF